MRVAILGAGHWHVTQFYLPALRKAGAQIVAAHDPDAATLERVCRDLSCPRYTDVDRLLEDHAPDLVFAHAPHADMTALADHLVQRHQPFHMEKPMGLAAGKLAAVAVKAQTEGVWTSVPLVSRLYGVVAALRTLKEAGELGDSCQFYQSLFAGSPLRYREWGVEWMLDPALAGPGPLWNFGPHVVDLFLHLVDDRVCQAQCWLASRVHGLAIPDTATLWLRGRSGVVGVAEVSYAMPDGYQRFFSLTTTRLHVSGPSLGCGEIILRDGPPMTVRGPDSDTVYEVYVAETLGRFSAGEPAVATVADMARTLWVLDACRESARRGEVVDVFLD